MRGLRAPPHRAVLGIGAAKAVAEKSALPERRLDALPDRRSIKQRARDEAAEADQPGVERFWPVGGHMRPHRRMHAVGTDQEITFGAGAVAKMRDDRLVGAVLNARKALLEMQPDVVAPGLVHDDLVQRGAAHVHRRLAETRLHVAIDRAEPAPRLRIEIKGFRDRAAADHRLGMPSSASTRMPFGAICRPPPAPFAYGQASYTAESMPAFRRKIAATGPAMPAPMIRALRGLL